MNDIDLKLREKLKMLDEIDRMVKNEPRTKEQGQMRINYSQNPNNNSLNNKSVDRYSNTNLSNDFDFPLQQSNTTMKKNNSRANISNTTNLNQSKTKESPKLNNLYSNFNNYSQPQQKSNDNLNYYSIYGNELISTKECTEPLTGKSKKNLKFNNERENTSGNGFNTGRSSKVTTKRSITPKKSDKSPKQLVNINININDNKGDYAAGAVGDRLYNYAFYIKDKIEKKRIEDDHKLMRQMTPEISTKAKSIQRDPKKFHERLYPNHKVNAPSQDYEINPSINFNVNMNVDSKNSIHTTPNFDDQKGNSFIGGYNEEDAKVQRIYRKAPSTSQLSLPFDYKPKLDKNSLKIAENLTPSKIRLLAKKPKRKDLSDVSYVSNDASLIRTPSRSPSRNLTPTNRHNELYSKGLEKMKKREIVHNQKKAIDDEEFKKYAFKPKIITHSPTITGRKHSKSPLRKGNKTSETIDDNSNNTTHPKTNFYDKNIHWKKNVELRTEKIKKNVENELSEIYTFKPEVHKNYIPNDEKFINKNIEQIENYVNKRRSTLQKKKEEEEYKKKKFSTGENYKCKMTIPKEFNLSTNQRSRSRDANRSRDNTESRSSNSPHNVNLIREQLRTNEFFQNENPANYNNNNNYHTYQNYHHPQQNDYNQPQLHNTNQPNTVRPSNDNSIYDFMSAINNLHENLLNFKV